MGEAINVHNCSCERWLKGHLWKMNEEGHWNVSAGMFTRVTEPPLNLNCRDKRCNTITEHLSSMLESLGFIFGASLKKI